MSGRRLADGGKPWFVRVRSRTTYKVNPCAPEGWMVLIGYCLLEIAVSLGLFLTGPQPPRMIVWVVWAILLVTLTAVLLVVVARKSLPLENKEGRR
jgi:hypothetical protein